MNSELRIRRHDSSRFILYSLFFILSAILYSLFVIRPAGAVSITPLTFDITADPGQVVSNRITMFNTEPFPVGFTIEAEDFTAIGESGGVAIADNVPLELSAKNWLEFSPRSVVIEPGDSADVAFTLRVPLDADAGGKYTSIQVSSVPGGVPGGSAIAQKIASLLLIRVTGLVKEDLAVSSFEAPSFLENGPVLLTLRLQNNGTVHLRPAGFVFLQNWQGNEVHRIELPQERVIPKTVRAINLAWDEKWLFGKYTANLAGVYGSANEPISGSASFWVVPWKIAGLAALALLVILGFFVRARHRVGMAFRILFRGE